MLWVVNYWRLYNLIFAWRFFLVGRVFVARSVEVVVRCIRAYQLDGTSLAMAPSFTVPVTVDAFGIISALRTEDWNIQKFCKDGEWKSLLIVADNAIVNRKVCKHLIVETEVSLRKKD